MRVERYFPAETLPPEGMNLLRRSILNRGGFVLVTGNNAKIRETEEILSGFDPRRSNSPLTVEGRRLNTLFERQGETYQIACEKAIQAARLYQRELFQPKDVRSDGLPIPCFVEDTALYLVDDKSGLMFPGPYVKKLFENGDDEVGCKAIIQMAYPGYGHISDPEERARKLKEAYPVDRKAKAQVVYAVSLDARNAIYFEADWDLYVCREFRQGPQPFSWDAVVYPFGYENTSVARLSAEFKHKHSMRAKALRMLYEFLFYPSVPLVDSFTHVE